MSHNDCLDLYWAINFNKYAVKPEAIAGTYGEGHQINFHMVSVENTLSSDFFFWSEYRVVGVVDNAYYRASNDAEGGGGGGCLCVYFSLSPSLSGSPAKRKIQSLPTGEVGVGVRVGWGGGEGGDGVGWTKAAAAMTCDTATDDKGTGTGVNNLSLYMPSISSVKFFQTRYPPSSPPTPP